jgi:hypothetical protein
MIPAASASRSVRIRLKVSWCSASGDFCRASSVSPPRNPHPKMSFFRSQSASASCVARSNIPSVYFSFGERRPSQRRRACTARMALRRD